MQKYSSRIIRYSMQGRSLQLSHRIGVGAVGKVQPSSHNAFARTNFSMNEKAPKPNQKKGAQNRRPIVWRMWAIESKKTLTGDNVPKKLVANSSIFRSVLRGRLAQLYRCETSDAFLNCLNLPLFTHCIVTAALLFSTWLVV